MTNYPKRTKPNMKSGYFRITIWDMGLNDFLNRVRDYGIDPDELPSNEQLDKLRQQYIDNGYVAPYANDSMPEKDVSK